MNFIRSGFRAVRQNPALAVAEIAWRWLFGAIALALVIFTLRTILQGIDVSAAEAALVKADDAYLIADIIVRILVQVLPQLARALLIIIPLLAVLWIVLATLGRAFTLRALGRDARAIAVSELFLLNCLRAVFTLATMLAFFGTVFLVSTQVTPATTPDAMPLYVLAWLILAFIVGCFWGLVNWLLALAPVFIARDGFGVGKAISESLGLYRDHRREYLAIASWFGFFRGSALVLALVAGSVVVASGGWRLALAGSIVVALIYFAIADYLYIVRLAAFVELANPAVQPIAEVIPPAVPPAPIVEDPNLKLETETRN